MRRMPLFRVSRLGLLLSLGALAGACGGAAPTPSKGATSATDDAEAYAKKPDPAASSAKTLPSDPEPSSHAKATGEPASKGSSAAASPPPAAAAPPTLPAVELVQVAASDDGRKPPTITLTQPRKGQIVPTAKAGALDVKLTVKDWSPKAGDHLCVLLDRGGCKRVTDPTQPLHLADVGTTLDEGPHVLTVLARRASGELFRPVGKAMPFASVSFFIGKRAKSNHSDGSPMILFVPPDEGPSPPEGVLIDFFVANAEMGRGKFIVHATAGGPGIENGVVLSLDENRPLRLKNARPGSYLARVTLLRYSANLTESTSLTSVTYTAQPILGPFAELTRSFLVTEKSATTPKK